MVNDIEKTSAAFREWLGEDAYSDMYDERYIDAVTRFVGNACAEDEIGRERSSLFRTADMWAARRLLPWSDQPSVRQKVVLPIVDSRDPFSGLRRGERRAPTCLNSGSEDELRQVPGIGAATARRIVREREAKGHFHTIEEAQARGCLASETSDLCAGYVSTGSTHSHELESQVDLSFGTYVRMLHAALRAPPCDLSLVAIETLEQALRTGVVARYWEPLRKPSDPVADSVHIATSKLQALRTADRDVLAATVDSEGYLKLLRRILPRAAQRVWLMAPSLDILHIGTLRWLLVSLAEAASRGVDVRILYDAGQKANVIDSDDIAFLRASGVPCRAFAKPSRQHARVLLVDGDHVVCGSQSWSMTSAYHSEELNLYTQSKRLSVEQAERFEIHWLAAKQAQALETSP